MSFTGRKLSAVVQLLATKRLKYANYLNSCSKFPDNLDSSIRLLKTRFFKLLFRTTELYSLVLGVGYK